MSTDAADLSLESERARILSEARILVARIADYTALINAWAEEDDPHAEQ